MNRRESIYDNPQELVREMIDRSIVREKDRDWSDVVKASEYNLFVNQWRGIGMNPASEKKFMFDLMDRPGLARPLLNRHELYERGSGLHKKIASLAAFPVNLKRLMSDSVGNTMLIVGSEIEGIFALLPDNGDVYYMCYTKQDLLYLRAVALNRLLLVWCDELDMLNSLNLPLVQKFSWLEWSNIAERWTGLLPMKMSAELCAKLPRNAQTWFGIFIQMLALISVSTDSTYASGPVLKRTDELRAVLKERAIELGIRSNNELTIEDPPENDKMSSWEKAVSFINNSQ